MSYQNVRLADDIERAIRVTHDHRRRNADHAIAGASEHPIAPGIGACSQSVVAAIDLDHEAPRGSEEVDDETFDHGLPPKPDAELTTAKRFPEPRFGRGWSRAHLPSIDVEESLACDR